MPPYEDWPSFALSTPDIMTRRVQTQYVRHLNDRVVQAGPGTRRHIATFLEPTSRSTGRRPGGTEDVIGTSGGIKSGRAVGGRHRDQPVPCSLLCTAGLRCP